MLYSLMLNMFSNEFNAGFMQHINRIDFFLHLENLHMGLFFLVRNNSGFCSMFQLLNWSSIQFLVALKSSLNLALWNLPLPLSPCKLISHLLSLTIVSWVHLGERSRTKSAWAEVHLRRSLPAAYNPALLASCLTLS